jgi:type II secretory pathway pseudopilin PulG
MRKQGYMLIMLLIAISVLGIGLLLAVPVWETQLRREKEEELIFRGKQYVEAIRLYQLKNPGAFPKSLKELLEEKCIRKLYKDPMSSSGEWNVILPYAGVSRPASGRTTMQSFQKVMVAPQSALASLDNPQIIGVVSSSQRKSIKIYLDQESYDGWLFFYGQDPKKMPEIVVYGEEEKD